MTPSENYGPDNTFWTAKTGKSLYTSYEQLKRRYISLTTAHDKVEDQCIVKSRFVDLRNIQEEIIEMSIFCKNSYASPDTAEFLKGLRSMYNACNEMSTELEKFL